MIKKVTYHLLFWLAFIGFDFLANMYHYQKINYGELLVYILIHLPAIVLATYLVAYWLVPRYLSRKRYVPFGAGILILMMLIYASRYGLTLYIWKMESGISGVLPLTKVLKNVIRDYAIVALAVCINIIAEWQQNLERVKELVRARTEAELNFLKGQLDPHFLFNMLNSIYSLALQQSSKTPESVLRLSGILDYIIYECRKEEVPLRSELKIVRDYICLERLRLGEVLEVEMEEQIGERQSTIPPLLLLPLVENAFKHGGKREGRFRLRITIRETNEKLYFEVINSMPGKKRLRQNGRKGIGLTNLQQRLELLYPETHTLSMDQAADSFSVKLRLPLTVSQPNPVISDAPQ